MVLSISDLSFSFGDKIIFDSVDMNLEDGSISCLLGFSGSGKTTFLRLITGLEASSSGSIYIDNQKNYHVPTAVSYMRQEVLLLPWRSVIQNVLLFTELGDSSLRDDYKNKAHVILRKLGLGNELNSFPAHLSAGMQQRVAIASALIKNSPLLLLDEPFSSLDVFLRETLYKEILVLSKEFSKTVLLITHDFRDAKFIADNIYMIINKKIIKYPLEKKFMNINHIEQENILCDIKHTLYSQL